MLSSLPHFWRGVRAIVALPTWRAQQALVILSEAVISFLALFLLEEGTGEMHVLGLLAGLYILTGILIRMHRLRVAPHPLAIPIALALLALAGAVATILAPTPESLALSALGILTLKDIATTGAVGDIHRTAKRIGATPTQLVSTGMLIGALLMIGMLWGSGQILSMSPPAWTGLIAAASLVILTLLLQDRMPIKLATTGQHIPRAVRLTCILSMTYNATSFVGKRFLLPVAVAQMARGLGLGAESYSALGMVLSILVLLGLATRSLSGIAADPRVMMFGGFFSGLALWLSLGILLTKGALGWPQAVAAMICLLAIEITAKLWTLGFIETLRVTASAQDEDESGGVEAAYFGYFMEMKGYGAGIGFLVAMGALAFQVAVIGPAALLGICLGAWVFVQTRPVSRVAAATLPSKACPAQGASPSSNSTGGCGPTAP